MFPILRMRSLMTPTFSLPRPPLFLVVLSKRFSFVSNPIDSTGFPLRSNALSAKSLVFHSHNKGLQSQPSCHVSSSPSGAIHVIVGPMFAGKTTTLLQRIQSETELGRKVAIIKSSKDTRYGLDSIVSHDGVKLPCWALSNLSSFGQIFGSVAYEQLDVIGIDEAQFFEDLYDFCREAADQHGKTVIVAGLDGDYLRRSFGSVLDIIPLADSVTKLTARCELCGKRALFTLRKSAEKQTELIGGADVYMPVCRQHYVSGQVAMEAARVALELQTVQCGSQV
ncbi:hypothetical protein K2173_018028 [Erythroxylum novogranatense]|uniref:Thymidine kinase n=1 Tax=Erythroxylum novogranatense TaxID=1862640 RepID=A0AAV8TUI2_9ROSI|nr:hypothetical protein K2173_018028 [Erythroxylum novogranatense]